MDSNENDQEPEDPGPLDPEEENALQAFEEYERAGTTSRRCLRCGGRFFFEDTPSGYEIRCETPNCFRLTSRGI